MSIVVARLSTGGTVVASSTVGPQGPPGPAVAPGTAGQFYVTNSTATAPEWKTLSGDVTDSVTTTGQIAVVKVNGASVPAAGALTTGNVLQVSGASALTYAPVNLAGGSNYITGFLPVTNIAVGTNAQMLVTNAGATAAAWVSMSGDATIAASGAITVSKVNGATIANTAISGDVNGTIGANHVDTLTGTGGTVTVPNGTHLTFQDAAAHPATTGDIRTKYNWTVNGRDFGNTFDLNILQFGTSGNDVYVGDQVHVGNSRLWGATSAGLQAGGGAYMLVTTTNYDWNGNVTVTPSTTPSIISGASSTSFTLGTNKSGASLNLQSGSATTSLSLTNPGGGSLVAAITQGQHFAHQVSKGTNYTIDSSGAGDEQIWMTAACTITLPNPASASGRCIEIIVNYDPAVGGGTIARNGSELINGAASNITLATGDKWTVLHVRSNGTDWVIGKSTAAP